MPDTEWVEYAPHPDCGCMLKQYDPWVPNERIQGWMIDHRPHGGRIRWKVTYDGVIKAEGKTRNPRDAADDMLEAYESTEARHAPRGQRGYYWQTRGTETFPQTQEEVQERRLAQGLIDVHGHPTNPQWAGPRERAGPREGLGRNPEEPKQRRPARPRPNRVKPALTPEFVREGIRRNAQSEEMRSRLIQAAVENDMADEIPDEWTVALYNPEADDVYTDTLDLIADHYEITLNQGPVHTTESGETWFQNSNPDILSIAAHESGAISIAMPPGSELIKFDIPTADRLLEMFNTISYSQTFTQPEFALDGPLVEPTTGITYIPGRDIAHAGYLVIPTQDGNDIPILFNDINSWVEGLSAMANAAETYGTSEEIQA